MINFNARIDERRMTEFANGLCDAGGRLGMQVKPPAKIFSVRNNQDFSDKLGLCKKNNMQVILRMTENVLIIC